ncbi:hypothetical protein IAU60_005987 [Kwoniella sp. DSM 27419]
MMLDGPSCSLPAFEPSTLYSFYPHPLSPRSHLHSTLSPSQHSTTAQAGPGPTTQGNRTIASGQLKGNSIRAEAEVASAMKRAELRALMGRRPAGTGLGKDDDEVGAEEDMLDQEQHDINMFGHRFLLPYGRRLTQMEMDAAPSPSPSEPDHERRQEDRTMGSPGSPVMQQEVAEEDEEGPVDLDASIEDLDASEVQEEDEGGMEE